MSNKDEDIPEVKKSHSAFKLERIKIPHFDGKMSEWQTFHDLFKSSVHLNSTLSGAEKLIHLKTYLTGDASSIISAFTVTDDNYKEAWKCVRKRYSNKREIIFSHLRKFDEIRNLTCESASGLRSISDGLNECVRSLKVLKVPVQHWDLIFIFLTLKKLDGDSRREWLLEQKDDDEIPTLEDFIQ